MLRRIDERHRKVARCMQNAEAQGTDENDIAGGRKAALPQMERPGEQHRCEDRSHSRMEEAQLLEIEKAAAARRHLAANRAIETAMLAAEPAEGAHQRQIRDDIDHLAVDRRRPVRKIEMKRRACGGKAEENE